MRERQTNKVKEMQVERSEEKGKKGPSQGGEQEKSRHLDYMVHHPCELHAP